MLRVLDDINDRVRIRRKIKGYFNKSLYKEFLKKNPEYKKVIDYDTFLKISDISNLKLKDALFENTDGVELPFHLGYLILMRRQTLKKKVNFNLKKKLNKTVYYNNWETENYVARVVYTARPCAKYYRDWRTYSFVTSKKLKGEIAKRFKKDYLKYLNVGTRGVSTLYKDIDLENEYYKLYNIES